MWHNIRTSQDTKYYSGDLVITNRKIIIIGKDQVLLLVKMENRF